MMREISEDAAYEADAKARHIDSRNWLAYVSTFRRRMVKEPVQALGSAKLLLELCRMLDDGHWLDLVSALPAVPREEQERRKQACKAFLFTIMIADAEKTLADVRAEYRTLCETSDLRIPHEWYPYARLMKRKIVYHGGPTNSGKTYHALQRLKGADPAKGGGLYCGPLRLLALEVYETLNKAGAYTDLLTGQERREVPFSTHTSCTVEMVNLNHEYDVAVIDEIQMIGNPQRGSAWTRALLGLRAREIHVCGGLEASTVVENLVTGAGDEYELRKYNRLSTLKIADESLKGDYSKIQPGDCVVAFSRADIFSIRRQIERLTPYKCAVIYGALPPETRSTQARLFNEDNTGYDVLVASDAIGMGLNLNIKRVVFHTTIKREGGKRTYWVDPSSVKQIGGRAGRLSSNYKEGEVTAWQEADLTYIRAVMSWEIPAIPAAGIFPSVEQVERFSQQLEKAAATQREMESQAAPSGGADDPDADADDADWHPIAADAARAQPSPEQAKATSPAAADSPLSPPAPRGDVTRLASLMERFVEVARVDGRFYLCDHQDMIVISNWLHTVPLTLAERFTFANAPVSLRDSLSTGVLYQFAASYALRRPVALNIRLSRQKPRDILEFSDLCMKHNILDLYLWLSLRFPDYFVEKDLCEAQKAHAIAMIEGSLDLPSLQQKFSHSREYQTVRQNMLANTPDALPPMEYGDVRQTTRELLATVDHQQLYTFPHLQEEEALAERAGGGPGPNRSSSGGGSGGPHHRGPAKQAHTGPKPPKEEDDVAAGVA